MTNLPKVDYDARQHAVYERGRAISEHMRQVWMDVFAGLAGPARPQTVLDLGSGTGRFTAALADTFGGPVHGVEPSDRMRARAEAAGAPSAVRFRSGSAEHIPLDDDSCDLVLMFLSLHHVADRPAAAAEVARVLRPGGRLLIRSTLADRIPDLLWHQYYPRAREIEARLFPTSDQVIDAFTRAGLGFVGIEVIRERYGADLAEYADRIRLGAISTFEFLTEAEIAEGSAAMAAAAAEAAREPVENDVDLMVFVAPTG